MKKLIKKFLIFLLSTPLCFVNKRKIVFDNFNGKGYGCNPKYIAEEIIRQNIDCDMVWLVKNLDEEMPAKIRKVKYGTFKAIVELATAKIWIDNVRKNTNGLRKKKNQYYIQTWHGALGIKGVEQQVEDTLSPEYVKNAKIDAKMTDLMISNNAFETKLFKEKFWYNGEVLEIGVPRNEFLINADKKISDKVYKYFKIDTNKKIVLYAPTFRKSTNIDCYKFDYEKCLDILKQRFNNDFVMLIRLHPNESEYSKMLICNDKVINATDYPDIQELLAVADIGITDYSSINFEMSDAGKVVFLICKDLDEYKTKERKFNFKIEELPFPFAITEKELFENIKNFDEKKYFEKCEKFYKNIGLISSNGATQKIVDIIKDKIK